MQPAMTMYFPTTGYYSYTAASGTYPHENSVPMEYYLPPAGIRVIAQHHQTPSSSGSDHRHGPFTHPSVNYLSHYPQWNNTLCYNGPTYYVAPTMYSSFPLPLRADTTGSMAHVVSIPSPDLTYSTMERTTASEHEQGTQ